MTHPRNSPTTAFWVVALAVFLATSTWFTGTAATPALTRAWELTPSEAAALTSATQFGFITGTILFALLNVSDLVDARRVFFLSATAAAGFNGAFAWCDGFALAVPLRALTGVALAGVYPVGMKILAGWFDRGLGFRLGVMVGALTLGTALPYLVRHAAADLPWRAAAGSASALAFLGGVLVSTLVGRGPHERSAARFDVSMTWRVFANRQFRLTALGYFGHMWELYALWAMTAGFLAAAHAGQHTGAGAVMLETFGVIGVGGLGCVLGGVLSRRVGSRRVALAALLTSGTLAVLSPLAFGLPRPWLLAYMGVWGFAVVADSPQFSALAAKHAPREYVGTALTVQNGIGFALTIVTLQLVPVLARAWTWQYALVPLALGPVIGAVATARLRDDRVDRDEPA